MSKNSKKKQVLLTLVAIISLIVITVGYYGQNNRNYYLYNSAIVWWTMSPQGFSDSDFYSWVWRITESGNITIGVVGYSSRLRAVLNLTADTQISDGDGTKENPFVIQ